MIILKRDRRSTLVMLPCDLVEHNEDVSFIHLSTSENEVILIDFESFLNSIGPKHIHKLLK